MEKFPLISVIMPAFNAHEYIHKAIESILDQTYSNWELLLCDDGSGDTTYEIMKEFSLHEPRIRLFRNPVNLKLLKTRNKLLKLSRGELITFQDADDYSVKTRLEKMVSKFQTNPNLGMLSSQVGFVNAKGQLLRVSNNPTDYESTLRLIYNSNVVGGSMMMIKKDALEAVGGAFRTYFDGLAYQDYDLSLLITEKFESYCLPHVLYYYRQHGCSTSKVIDADRLLARQIVIQLAMQRKQRGTDDLMDGHPEKVDGLLTAWREPYSSDPSLVFREFAASFMYNRLFKRAIHASWLAACTKPLKWDNWATLQYCLRQTLISYL